MQRLVLTKHNRKEIVAKAITTLKQGGLVIYPTETCYGVAANAVDKDAVSKLLLYKRRPEGKAVSVAVSNRKMAEVYVNINKTAGNIYDKFLPGPVTVVSKSRQKLDRRLEAEDGTLGIRIPDHELALLIIKELGSPITATSANSSGKKTPYTIEDVLDNLNLKQKDLIDLIIDAGELPHNPPSTVIDTTKEELKVLRVGGYSLGTLQLTREINAEHEMQLLGHEIMNRYFPHIAHKPFIIMFNADLGAGKTQFIKGMAKALQIKEIVNSPTFIIMKEYIFKRDQITGKLIHLDAWRLESLKEMQQLNLEQYLHPGNIIAVEWAGMARDYLSQIGKIKDLIRIYVEIEYLSLDKRKVHIYEE